MAKLEERPVDSGVAAAKAKDDAALIEWWKDRLVKIANIPTDIARAGALLPQMRELSRTAEGDRRRLTKARVQAFVALPTDQRERILTARRLTHAADPALAESDEALAAQVAQDIPGAPTAMGR